jgi:type IV secretory pathway TraG/TraD family ATPase VirD4
MYKDDWQTMIGNCDSFLFLGGQEYDTLDYISKELGDQTITAIDSSRSHGKSGSSSQSRKKQGRKLMFADEIGRLDDSECILIIRGLKPFLGKKYEYTKHPNYRYTGDADSKLIYTNTKDNTIMESQDSLETKYAESKVLAYTKAAALNRPDTRILGDIKSIHGLAKSLNIKNAEEVFTRFTLIHSDFMIEGFEVNLN